jgi:Tol biopolymer transport system component
VKGDLDTIVAKALKKDPLERYAAVAELAEDLRRHLASEPIHARRDRLVRRAARFVRRHPVVTAAGTIGILAVGGAAGFYALRPAAEERSRAAVAEPAAPAPVTSDPGDERMPSLSPDGTRLAFSWVPPNASNARIVVRTIGTDPMTQLTDGSADDVSPIWSPDGQHIAFVRGFREPEQTRQICVVPMIGGPIRVLHTRGFSPTGLAWWEAGNALLFPMWVTASAAFRLAAVDLATLDVRLLTGPSPSPGIASLGDFLPAVAPDGRTVAFVRETKEGRDVYLLDLVTGTERRLTRDHHRITGLTWSPEGQTVIMSSSRTGADGLYRVSIVDGAIVRVPNTTDGATQPMAGRGGPVFSQLHADSNIYRADVQDARTVGQGRLIIASSRADLAPDISPDGRSIAFLSTRGGGQDIWIASADGLHPRRLTSLSVTSGPRWSRDGRSIAFGAQAPGMVRPEIWIVDAGGGTPTRLTNDPAYETILAWAADGASVYFRSDRGGGFEVWNMPVRGGPATQVTQGQGLRAQESADGQFLYYSDDVPQVWRRPLRGASAEELVTTFQKARIGVVNGWSGRVDSITSTTRCQARWRLISCHSNP